MSEMLRESQHDQLLTIEEAAARLGVNYHTLYRRIKSGSIPAYRIGGWRVDLAEVKRATLNLNKEPERWESTNAATPSGLTSTSTTNELDELLALVTAKRPKNSMTS
jgi:excisionase family DNA binding protein